MFIQHGMPYMINYEEQASRFLPFFGLDARLSLAAVILTEVGGSLLIILGCHMRLAAVALSFVMAVAFVLVHGASFQGEQSGELAFIYLITTLTLVITGPGRYALSLNKRFAART